MKQQLGQYKVFRYKLNVSSGYFEKQPSEFTFQKLPFELKREPAQCNYLKSQGANEILQSRQKGGKRAFHSGLIPISSGAYQGDHFELIKGKKQKSLIIFIFEDLETLTAYFFNRYYIDKRETRLSRCKQFVEAIKKEGEINRPQLKQQLVSNQSLTQR